MRQTGRTTRMIEAAKAAAADGRAVYVLCANEAQRRWMEKMIGPGNHGIKAETWESLNVNVYNMEMLGANRNCELFVDHYAVESRLERALWHLHRFDDPDLIAALRQRERG